MTSDSYKSGRSTQRRVDDRSQRYHPAQDPVHGLDDRIEREQERPFHTIRISIETMTRWAESRKALEAERDRLLDALKSIVAHADMPAGESWVQAYVEVTTIAREALSSAPRASKAPTSSTGDTDATTPERKGRG